MARAVKDGPEMLEDRGFLLQGQCVPVIPTQTEVMLCIARLPFSYTKDQFTTLVKSYGEVINHFLISKKTGESKGYGFVKYATKKYAQEAKRSLNNKEIDGWTLVCDWADSCYVTQYESLHSKCLYVDCLPKYFRDMNEFRKIFSTVINPPYCQIALKDGCPQDWGLVEYNCWEDAEAAQMALNGYCLRGQKIRISYYIPGVRAINLYLKLLDDPGPKSASLLPNPSGQVITESLRNLFKQNRTFAKNLQDIILGEIQASKNGKVVEGQKEIPLRQGTANRPNISKNEHGAGGRMFRNISVLEKWKPFRQATTPGHLSTKNGLHATYPPPIPGPSPTHLPPTPGPSPTHLPPTPGPGPTHLPPTPGPSPTQFLKHIPPQKIPLWPNPGETPPSARRLGLSPPTEVTTTVTLEEETQSAFWANILGHVYSSSPLAGIYNNFTTPPLAVHPEPTICPFNIPPPNYIGENISNIPIEIQQGILNTLSNPQNLQQTFKNLHFLGQPACALPSPVPVPPFSYPLNPIAPAIDQSWAIPSSVPQPYQLPCSLLTNFVVAPKPVNYLEVESPLPMTFPAATIFLSSLPFPQPLFSPFSAPDIIWPQPSTSIIASPQPDPLMTPIGQKRRLLLSPEPSQEGNYICQHSQGFRGHDADMYIKRKKL